MRVLLLFRGAPGAGKSTYIEEHGLKPYTLCADDIRLLCQSPIQTPDGEEAISNTNDRVTWDCLFRILEVRMQRGEFTVIDATNSKTSEMKRYKDLASNYRYRIFIIDLTDLPIEECKKRNNGRIPLKRVPDEVIDRMYSRFATQKIPAGITKIKSNELDKIFIKKFNMSEYESIRVIGDVHGCNSALQEYFEKYPYNEKYYYIFIGDYFDRGIENADTINFIMEFSNKQNVLCLEGNHERHYWDYCNDERSKSKEFELFTKRQLDDAKIDKKEGRQFYRKLGQCAWFDYRGKEFFISHAGIAAMPENLGFMATDQFIHGVGSYGDFEKIAETWNNKNPNIIQIHGHRNTKSLPIKINDTVYNLEGKIEFGGHLRIAHINGKDDSFNIDTIEIKNNVFKSQEEKEIKSEIIGSDVTAAVLAMRSQGRFIKEKQFGNISSFNFSERAFNSREWNSATVKARGLYIDTEKMKIVARSYDKFFNINELEETRLANLQFKLEFPIQTYVKENGYLCLLSVYNNELFFATKSDCGDGLFKQWFIDAFNSRTTEDSRERIKEFIIENDVTLVFENVDMKNDPHIIKYDNSELYLLDIIKNDLTFTKFSYEKLCEVSDTFGLKHKLQGPSFATWQEFYDWYNEVTTDNEYTFDNRIIEGFVIEGSNGYMTKLKLLYYHFWKFMRAISAEVINKGYITDTQKLTSPLANYYYGWLKVWVESIPNKDERKEIIPKNIIVLRDKFLEEFTMDNYVLS